MSVGAKHYFVGITLIVVTILVKSTAAQLDTNRCESGWGFFPEGGSRFANGMCYLVVKTPMPVADAERYCADRMAYLIDLERIDQFLFFDRNEDTITVPKFIFDNFIDFWSGMRVSEADRLVWHAYGPKYVKVSQSSIPWNWKQGQPISNYSDTCGSVTLGQREVTSEVTEVTATTTEVVFNGQVDVGLDECTNSLPFVCQKPTIQKIVNPTNICPDGWVGNQYLDYCYQLVNETATLDGAHQQCKDLGGYLTVVNDPGFNSFNQSLLEIVYFWYFQRNEGTVEIPFNEVNSFWADLPGFKSDSEIVGQCNSFRFNFETVDLSVSLCDDSLNFMCSRPILSTVDPSISLESPYLDQNELLNHPQWAPLQLSFMLDRSPKDNEIVFLKTPTTYLDSNGEFSPSESQNIRYTVEPSEVGDNPYYVNITIIRNIVPQRKRRQIGEGDIPGGLGDVIFGGNSELVDFNQVIQTTGYYSLGVFQLSPPSYTETEPKLVRYSESDLYIYLAFVPVRDWVFQSGDGPGQFSEQDIVLQRLLNDRVGVFETFQDVSIVISGSGPILPGEEIPVFQNYGGIVEDIRSKPGMMTLRLFATPFNSRNLILDSEQGFVLILQDYLRSNLNGDAFDIGLIRVVGTVSCSTQDFTDARTDTIFTLPSTRSGETGYSWERCYGGKGAYAKAVCEGGYDTGARWGQIEYNTGCEVFPELNTSSSTRDLKILSETIITDDNVNTILKDTYNLTLPELNLTSADIIYTAEILYNFWKFTNDIPVDLDDVYSVLNNILQALPNEILSAQELNNAANRIILSVDEITHLFEIRGMRTLRFVRSFVASTVRYQTGRGNIVIGLELEDSPVQEITDAALLSVEQPSDVSVSKTDTAIYLSREIVEGAPTRLSFHIYSKTELFATPSGRFKVNSKVAAARMEKNGIPILDLGEERVTVVFETIEDSDNAVCGYWNYSADETAGGWETEGCVLLINGSKTVCECDHLTNFAVLIDLEASTIPEAHKAILDIVTKVGLVISAIALGITVLTFLVFKHLRSGRGQQVLVNLSVAMLCSAIIFLVGMDRVESVTGCKVVAALLHYFILVSFAWMLVEGILQYLRFVKVLGTYIPKFMMKSMIPAWGIPLIPVIVVLAVDHDLYYGGKGYCWLAYDAMLYAFIIPIAVVIFANLVVFTIVIVNLCRRRNKGMKTNQSERKMAMLHFQAGVSIFVLLGLTWVFGFMAVNEAQLVFHYLFAILNAFQGLFIFLLFTAREPQIRKAWRKLCCKKSQYKATGTGSDSNTGKKSADTHSTSDSKTTSAQFNNPQFRN